MAVLVAVRVVDVKNGDVTVLSHLGPQDAPVEVGSAPYPS
jgi:hypothetical protein